MCGELDDMMAGLGGSWSPADDGLVLLMLAQVRENEQNAVWQPARSVFMTTPNGPKS